jgi:hypothetical protein
MSVKYWHFNTEEQVRAAFPDYQACNAKITTQKRYSLKLVNMKNTRVTDCPTEQAVLFQ